MDTTQTVSPGGVQAEPAGTSRPVLVTMGVLAVAIVGLAAALVMSSKDGTPPADTQAVVTTTTTTTVPKAPLDAPDEALPKAAAKPTPKPAAKPVQQAQGSAQNTQRPDTRTAGANPAPACANCGVVESVTTVQRQEQVEGIAGTPVTLGTVAGGVIGGLLGNQVGKGSGKTVATVAGVAGGAYAGNQIEKNMKSYTAYQMHVRMADGSTRTIEQRNAVAAGTRVVVDGNSLRAG